MKYELALLICAISLNALNNGEEKVIEYLLGLKAGIHGFKNAVVQVSKAGIYSHIPEMRRKRQSRQRSQNIFVHPRSSSVNKKLFDV